MSTRVRRVTWRGGVRVALLVFLVSGAIATQTAETKSDAPTINLLGPEIVYLELGDTYTEEGAIALDGDGNPITEFAIDSSAVDTTTYSEHVVSYRVETENGTASTSRIVRVWPALTINVSGNGTTKPEGGRTHHFRPGSTVDIRANDTRESYFSGWEGGGVSDPTARITTVSMDTSRVLSAAFQDGLRLRLRIEGQGAIHYTLDGVEHTLTSDVGTTELILQNADSQLSVSARPERGVTEFWLWANATYGHGSPQYSYFDEDRLPLRNDGEIVARFVPEGMLEFVTITMVETEGGTTSLPPGTYRIPRYAGGDLDCILACQRGEPKSKECRDCRFTGLRMTVQEEPGWMFARIDGDLFSSEGSGGGDYSVNGEFSRVLAPLFVKRDRATTLDLPEHLRAFLAEIGEIDGETKPYDFDTDWGGYVAERGNPPVYRGNGILDIAEFEWLRNMVLAALDDYESSDEELLVGRVFLQNRRQAATDLVGHPQYTINVVAAYMTLGGYGERRRIAESIEEHYGVHLSLDDYSTNAEVYFGSDRDPDQDGIANVQEWAIASDDKRDGPAGNIWRSTMYGGHASAGASTDLGSGLNVMPDLGTCDCEESKRPMGPLTIRSHTYSSISAYAVCVDTLSLDMATEMPLGQRVLLRNHGLKEYSRSRLYSHRYYWDAPGTLIDGSFRFSVQFTHTNPGQEIQLRTTPDGTLMVQHDSFRASDASIYRQREYSAPETFSGPPGSLHYVADISGGGWQANGGVWSTHSPVVTVRMSNEPTTLSPLPRPEGTPVVLGAAAEGGGEVTVSRYGSGEGISPFVWSAVDVREDCAEPRLAQFTALPHPGWEFDHWDTGDTEETILLPYTCESIFTIAHFRPLAQLTLDAAIEGAPEMDGGCGGYSVAKTAKAYYGGDEVVAVTAIAHPGYTFVEWQGEGVASPTSDATPSAVLHGTTTPTIYLPMGDSDKTPKNRRVSALFRADGKGETSGGCMLAKSKSVESLGNDLGELLLFALVASVLGIRSIFRQSGQYG